MPRSSTTRTFSITFTPEQYSEFQTIPGDRSKLVRQLIREYMQQQGLATLSPDAPAPIETARKTRWKKTTPE